MRGPYAGGFRLLPLIGLLTFAAYGGSNGIPANAASPSDAIARALAAEGVDAEAEDVLLLDAPDGFRGTLAGGSRAVVRGKPKGESQHDVFIVRTRRSPEGAVIAIESVHNLTRTAGVDETRPARSGEVIAFATLAGGLATGVELYDLAGEDPHTADGWSKLQRTQNSIDNWQRYGSEKGVGRKRYALDPQPTTLSYQFVGGRLEIEAEGRHVVVDPNRDAPIDGASYARLEHAQKGKPGDLVTWTVDRVRKVPWLGPHFIEALEYYAFTARDWYKRKFGGPNTEETAKDIKADLGEARIKPTYTDPEIGFPPAPLKPLLSPAIANEGVWLGTEDDPFVGKNPGVPGAFVQTFIRTDPQRSYARVYVTLWDPRQVALHMVAGTVEPVSATGEVGTGQIPRTPEVLDRLVAGFNGGFQAVHFEGGMQANGTLFLPPKAYAGTVAELRDGTTAIGTWPDGKPDVPDEILSMRQNLVPIVRDGAVNPYHLVKWGGTPPGSADNIHTTRSGVCLTKDGFVAYFFGNDMSHETLAQGMLAASCKVAVHLDMNAGHTGFEFYRVAPNGELPDLMRGLSGDWEAEGHVPQLEGWSFRARRMIKGMPHMNFPRYIGRDGRDFMYLTLRSILPGNPLIPRVSPADKAEGQWRIAGLPQHGFPYAIATTTFRPDAKQPNLHARLLKVDPRTVKLAAPDAQNGASTVLAVGGARPATKGAPSLWLAAGSFAIGVASPGPGATALFGGEAGTEASLAKAEAMVGVGDEDGHLVYAVADAPAGPALKALLAQMGCSQTMVVAKSVVFRLGGGLDLNAELAKDPLVGPVAVLSRAEAPAARELFPDTPVVPPTVWQPLQAKRVRYFGRKAAPAKPSAEPPPSPAPSSSE